MALEVIGRGGMGIVYRAVDAARERQVAIKVLRRALLSDEHRRRFTLEAEILRQLRHPGIGRILHAGVGPLVRADTVPVESDALPYFVMEYISGVSLTTYAEGNHLDVRQRLALLAKVCEAVQYAHHRGIVHRDLKPDNILVDAAGQPKILDFGIAHILAFQSTLLKDEEGTFAGTPEYASPEQLVGKLTELTPRSDVYALGLIAHELLAGRPPRRDGATFHLELRRVSLGDAGGGVVNAGDFSRTLTAIVATALRMTEGPAYACAGEFGADIEQLLAQVSPRSRWQTFKQRLADLLTSRPKPVSADASRPLSAVLRQRIAMAVESKHYRSMAGNGDSNADALEAPPDANPTQPRAEP
jgi:serine/threonine protein kinase